MRALIWIIVIAIILFAGWKLFMTEPPQDLPAATVSDATSTPTTATSTSTLSGDVVRASSTVQFTGYGPGKEHPVSFDWTENLTVTNGALAGSATFNTASVKADNDRLTTHLCSDDFFNCAVNKEIVFTVTEASASQVTGTLSFAGKTHTVSFPVTIDGNMIKADFRLDRTPFNFKYTIANAAAVDKEIRVQITLAVE
jgi:polyisoprenoid-binding protein YceI